MLHQDNNNNTDALLSLCLPLARQRMQYWLSRDKTDSGVLSTPVALSHSLTLLGSDLHSINERLEEGRELAKIIMIISIKRERDGKGQKERSASLQSAAAAAKLSDPSTSASGSPPTANLQLTDWLTIIMGRARGCRNGNGHRYHNGFKVNF